MHLSTRHGRPQLPPPVTCPRITRPRICSDTLSSLSGRVPAPHPQTSGGQDSAQPGPPEHAHPGAAVPAFRCVPFRFGCHPTGPHVVHQMAGLLVRALRASPSGRPAAARLPTFVPTLIGTDTRLPRLRPVLLPFTRAQCGGRCSAAIECGWHRRPLCKHRRVASDVLGGGVVTPAQGAGDLQHDPDDVYRFRLRHGISAYRHVEYGRSNTSADVREHLQFSAVP